MVLNLMRNLTRVVILLVSLVIYYSSSQAAISLTSAPGPKDFILVKGGTVTSILVDQDEDKAVQRVANDLADDIQRVTGTRPAVIHKLGDNNTNVVIFGTFDKSSIIKQ